MDNEERLFWIVWVSLIFMWQGLFWACVHFGNMLVFAGGVNYLRKKYP